jgi:hypothetical protein
LTRSSAWKGTAVPHYRDRRVKPGDDVVVSITVGWQINVPK